MTTIIKDYLIELQEKHEDNGIEDDLHYDDNINLQINDALLHVIDYMDENDLDEMNLEDNIENEFYMKHVKDVLEKEAA